MSKSIEIVNYHPKYAAGIAEMWDRSQDEWGGGTTISTAEQVKREEENSDSLAVFLAVCGEEVVGYCSLSEYREDTGALYIQLLNVRPDYHGKKIGKMLVLRAVEETILRGWPRVDLYTWEANMKAVPLYKRCGFFWEDREDMTHFMNFIPQVVKCAALAPYLEGIDWYTDSARTIEVAPDGKENNGFHTYIYEWQKAGRELRVGVERRGRGICLIETEDYLLSATVEQAEPVFGQEYMVRYHIVNKSGASLRLDIEGVNDRNITFDWRQTVDVESEQLLTARFFVGEIEEPQSDRQTCPTVRANVKINGREAVLQVGIVPKFPANIMMKVPDLMYAQQGRYEFYLDMENHYPEAAFFTFELASEPWLQLERRECTVHLEAKERISLPVPCKLLDNGFYEKKLEVFARLESGQTVRFVRSIGGGFRGPGAMCVGETEHLRVAMNGKYTLEYSKEDNSLQVVGWGREYGFSLMHPQVGKPYSGELSKIRPKRVERIEGRGAVGFIYTYRSDAFSQVLLHVHSLLYADGTVKLWQELENVSDRATAGDMWISQRVIHELYRAVLPYDGRYVEMNDSHGSDYDYWNGDKVGEPWLFFRGDGVANGICWSDMHRMNLGNWFLELETPLGQLEAGERKRSGEMMLSLGGFDDWRSFRDFALKRAELPQPLQAIRDVALTVNDGNPFVLPGEDGVSVTLHDVKQSLWEGEVAASYDSDKSVANEIAGGEPSASKVALTLEEEIAEVRFTLPLPHRSCDTVRVDARLSSLDESYRTALFPISSGSVECWEMEEADKKKHEVNNGLIRISASAEYYPGLRSLTVGGREWLASGFPVYGSKSWWNPWIGGMYDQLNSMGPLSVLKEERSVSFMSQSDAMGNNWSGIRVRLSVRKHEKYKGLTCDMYYLMLPGAPVLAYWTEIRQETGTYLYHESSSTEMFLRLGESPGEDWLRTFGPRGETIRYRLGSSDIQVDETKDYVFGRDGQSGVMHVVTDESMIRSNVYSTKGVACLTFNRRLELPHGSVNRSAPVFFVFADDLLPVEALHGLRQLTFPNS